MGVGDSDLIFKALDAAEAKLSDSVEESVSDASPEIPEESAEPTDPVEEAAVAEKFQETQKKTAPDRDERGKFQKKAAKAAKPAPQKDSQVPTDQEPMEAQAQEQSDAQGSPIEIPGMWAPKEKEVLAKAPRDVQELIAKREAQRAEYDRKIASEIEPARAFKAKVREMFEPHRARFQVNGVRDEMDAVGRLLAWNEIFESDPRKGIYDLMQKNGLSGYDFIQQDGEGAQYSGDPRLDQALSSLDEIRQANEELRQKLEAQESAQGAAAIESFKTGKDSFGNTRAQFFDAYKPQIVEAFKELSEKLPQMPEPERLHHAYEAVLQWTRELHGVNAQAAQAKPQAAPGTVKADPMKARAAAKSVTGAPSSGVAAPRPKLKGNNFSQKAEAAIDSVLDRFGL